MIGNAVPLDAERGWMAPAPIPYEDGSVSEIFAYHFFEHLSGADAIAVLSECERVLKVGGTINTVIPLAGSIMAFQDLDHKSFWNEESWRVLFDNPYYDGTVRRNWKLQVNFNFIFGLNQRNLTMFSQISKVEEQ